MLALENLNQHESHTTEMGL